MIANPIEFYGGKVVARDASAGYVEVDVVEFHLLTRTNVERESTEP